ncbi:MAG: hypothetical protein M3081_20865, partial [Gemmatimonadota bacterium]|nr:hypothetical protein [Gemmatimonadota bacterium]
DCCRRFLEEIMQRIVRTLSVISALAAGASVAAAQDRGYDRIPPGQMPPAGLCRIWIDGVPPGRQPAATDCRTAERNVPRNGRVIYGSGVRNGDVNDRDRHSDDDRNRRGDNHNNEIYDPCAAHTASGRCIGGYRSRYPNNNNPNSNNPNTNYPNTNNPNSNYPNSNYPNSNYPNGGYPTVRIPTTGTPMPMMPSGNVITRTRQLAIDRSRWLGDVAASPEQLDVDSRGVPHRIVWRDASNNVLEDWIDQNGDARADVVNIYDRGRVVRTLRW